MWCAILEEYGGSFSRGVWWIFYIKLSRVRDFLSATVSFNFILKVTLMLRLMETLDLKENQEITKPNIYAEPIDTEIDNTA